MKANSLSCRRSTARAVGCLAVLMLCFSWPVLAGEEPGELRLRAQMMERKAQELKAEGQHERAQQVMREVDELRAQARRAQPAEPGFRPDSAERNALHQKHAEALAELRELRAAGKEEAAMDKKRQVLELEREMERVDRPPRGRGQQFGFRRGMQPPPRAMQEPQQRLHHLQVAIEHLHAAGMHEPAERLAQEAEAMRRQFRGGSFQPPPPGEPGNEIQRLRAEIDELRQAIQQMRARIEEMSQRR